LHPANVNLLFYDDSPVYGGHEVMTLLGIESLLSSNGTLIKFLASENNKTLHEKLNEIARNHAGLEVISIAETSSKFEGFRKRLKRGRINALAQRLRELSPDLVVAVQGNIEHSSFSLLAARKAGLKVTSYIPAPHSNAEMGAKLGTLRDFSTPPLFRTPDSFITISHEMARMLRSRGATCPIEVVYNGIDTDRFRPQNKEEARAALDLPSDVPVFGVVGRIEFRQKQQHLLAQAVATDPALASCHLLFAGDGPDADLLDTSALYPALDALVIPSRYEGLPLVMLEALACGVSVLASDRDGMRDVLPESHRFATGDQAALGTSLRSFLEAGCPPAPEELVLRVRETMNLPSFGKAFSEAVFGQLAA
jgi:glycosyltransferase involved in cell wall biosynthesis